MHKQQKKTRCPHCEQLRDPRHQQWCFDNPNRRQGRRATSSAKPNGKMEPPPVPVPVPVAKPESTAKAAPAADPAKSAAIATSGLFDTTGDLDSMIRVRESRANGLQSRVSELESEIAERKRELARLARDIAVLSEARIAAGSEELEPALEPVPVPSFDTAFNFEPEARAKPRKSAGKAS